MAPPPQIGPFEVVEQLGAGGMGVVFKARDTRLNRFVALKFLPEGASQAARDRFQREALAIAALNHPHICTLYDVGEHAGQPYLAMELLEGESLYQRMAREPASVEQLQQWGAEIADALQAAHAKGILHRDLKPGNIFITTRGSVKVLDFGLAQFVQAAAADTDGEAPTVVDGFAVGPLTAPGAMLGTYAYMSPEQARGLPTDARSDLFSLGVVLYEMAAGKPPFQGPTGTDIAAAILLSTPPPPSTVRPELPARLDDIIVQCLEKDPDQRFQSAADLRVSLRRLAGAVTAAPATASGAVVAAAPATAAPATTPAATAAALVVGAATAWWVVGRTPAPPQYSFRQLTFSGQVTDAAISPDGKFMAYVDAGANGTSVHLMSVGNGSDAVLVPPAPGCCGAPSFSTSGDAVYFTQGKVLKAVPVLGGAVRVVMQNVCSGAGFSPDGNQFAYLANVSNGDTLNIANADGSGARLLSHPSQGGFEGVCYSNWGPFPDAPAWSPDGKAIAAIAEGSNGMDQIELVRASDGHASPLGPTLGTGEYNLAWLPDGSGLIMTAPIPTTGLSQLWEVTYPGGKLIKLSHDMQGYVNVTLARQTGQLGLVHAAPQDWVWAQTKPGGGFVQLAGGGSDQDGSQALAWTPDGRIISVHQLGGTEQLWLEGGNAPPRQIPALNLPFVERCLMPFGGSVMFEGTDTNGVHTNIWSVNLDGSGLHNVDPKLDTSSVALLQHGKTLAFIDAYIENGQQMQKLAALPATGGTLRLLSPQQIFGGSVAGMPDGEHVLADAIMPGVHQGQFEIFSLDGGPPAPVQPREMPGMERPYAVTPDGRALAAMVPQGLVTNVWAMPFDGSAPYPLTHFTDQQVEAFAFSADGRLAVSRGQPNSDAVVATPLGK